MNNISFLLSAGFLVLVLNVNETLYTINLSHFSFSFTIFIIFLFSAYRASEKLTPNGAKTYITPFGAFVNNTFWFYDKNIGEVTKMKYQRLIDLREDADQKQFTIAELLNTSQTQYSRWERGEREIPFHHIITLAKFYDCSIDYIAGLTNIRKPTYPRK